MSQATTTLDTQALEQMVAAAGAATGALAPSDGAAEYPWRTPCRFTRPERERLDAFARDAAERISKDLTALLRRQCEFRPQPVAQHYGEDLWQPNERPVYGVPLADAAGRPAGFIGLEPAAALDWVDRLLGGSQAAPTAARELSSLESALLVDIVAAAVQALCGACREAGVPALRHVEKVTTATPPPGLAGQEFCALALMGGDCGLPAGRQTARPTAVIALPSDLLVPVADPESRKAAPPAPQEIRRRLLAHLEGVSVTATVRLGTVGVAMRDAMALEPGDVLLLGRAAGEPVELLIMGNVIRVGLPVACQGNYAFQVREARQWPRICTY
ncbi:MAG: hypothetical protein FJ288_14655 [Planctomycetes bacterium]|nr:hypothetical protein [Planctomycetota bacterium]